MDLSDKKHFVVPFDYFTCHLYTLAVSLCKMKTHCYENWANIKVYKDNMADNVGISSATEICCSIVCELRVVILPLEINLEEKFKTCIYVQEFQPAQIEPQALLLN